MSGKPCAASCAEALLASFLALAIFSVLVYGFNHLLREPLLYVLRVAFHERPPRVEALPLAPSSAPTTPAVGPRPIYAVDPPTLTVGFAPAPRSVPPVNPGYYLRPWPGADIYVWHRGAPVGSGHWFRTTGSDVWWEPTAPEPASVFTVETTTETKEED